MPIVSAHRRFSSGLPEVPTQPPTTFRVTRSVILLGVAAAFLAIRQILRRFNGWMRSSTTAMFFETHCEHFLSLGLQNNLGLAAQRRLVRPEELIFRRSGFLALQRRSLVEKKAKDWVMEFQRNLSTLKTRRSRQWILRAPYVETAQ